MQGHLSCKQALAAAAFAVDKHISIVMGALLTLHADHAVFAIIEKRKGTLTTQRASGYGLMLSRPALNIVRCHIVDLATFIAHEVQDGEEVHNCVVHTPNESIQAEEDPIPDTTVMFVDGSSIIHQEKGLGTQGQR